MRFTRSRPSASLAAVAFGLSRSFAAVCASPYDRSAVRPTAFSSYPPRMDIHSIPRGFQHTPASLSLLLLLPLSISLPLVLSPSALSTVSLRHLPRLLTAVPYMHSQSVSFSRLYTLDEISHSEYIRKGVGERDEDAVLVCTTAGIARHRLLRRWSMFSSDRLFDRRIYLAACSIYPTRCLARLLFPIGSRDDLAYFRLRNSN